MLWTDAKFGSYALSFVGLWEVVGGIVLLQDTQLVRCEGGPGFFTTHVAQVQHV